MKVVRLGRRVPRCRVICLLFVAGLGTVLFAGPVKGDGKDGPRIHPRVTEEIFYSDVRLAGAEQLLQKPLEKKAEAEAAFIRGIIAEDEGAFDDALRDYTTALQLDAGSNPELTVRIAREYAKRGDVATGIDLLKDLAKAFVAALSDSHALAALQGTRHLRMNLLLDDQKLAVRVMTEVESAEQAQQMARGYQGLLLIGALSKKGRDEEAIFKSIRVTTAEREITLSEVGDFAPR